MVLEPARVIEMVEQARDAMTVRRVYGDPIERDGVTVIPAASIRGGGGAGGGGGTGPDGEGQGAGGGFGINARPAGVFVLKDGDVRWEAAVDVNQLILVGQLLGLAAILTVRSYLRHRRS